MAWRHRLKSLASRAAGRRERLAAADTVERLGENKWSFSVASGPRVPFPAVQVSLHTAQPDEHNLPATEAAYTSYARVNIKRGGGGTDE